MLSETRSELRTFPASRRQADDTKNRAAINLQHHVRPRRPFGPEHFARLVAKVAEERDRQAFTELFDHFAPRLKAYLLRLGADRASAEELTQEVMVTLWRKAALFDRTKSSVATWIYRIARNRRIDMLRRSRADAIDPNEPMLLPAAPEPIDSAIDMADRDVRVRQALERLPEEQALLIRLAFFRGLSHSQIAGETGLPLGTVKSRIRLAFHRLRRTLEGDGIIGLDP